MLEEAPSRTALLVNWAFAYGDPESLDNEILRSVVGSGVHGIAIAGTDDHDEMGIYIDKPDHVFAVSEFRPDAQDKSWKLGKRRDDFTARTQPEGERSGPGDTDLVVYSLRKYLKLAVKGNPTALLPLYAPEKDLIKITPLGEQLRMHQDWFLSELSVKRFMGYMHAQHERMLGRGAQGRVPNRPELIEQYGWDVKYGSHALRLAYQGWEIAAEGTLTLPLAEEDRERVLKVKTGQVSREEVSEEITDIETSIQILIDGNRLAVPKQPNYDAIETWSFLAHMEHWTGAYK